MYKHKWQRPQKINPSRQRHIDWCNQMQSTFGSRLLRSLSEQAKGRLMDYIRRSREFLRHRPSNETYYQRRGAFVTRLRTFIDGDSELKYCYETKSVLLDKRNWDSEGNFMKHTYFGDGTRTLDQQLMGQSQGDPTEDTITNIERSLVLMEQATQEMRAANSESEIVLADMRNANLIK